jgi:hypothetical protein
LGIEIKESDEYIVLTLLIDFLKMKKFF